MRRGISRLQQLFKSRWTRSHETLCRRCLLPASDRRTLSHWSWAHIREAGEGNTNRRRLFPVPSTLCEAAYSVQSATSPELPHYIDTPINEVAEILMRDVSVIEDFVSEEEEKTLMEEIEPHLKRLKYQKDHWDDAIHSYRETERMKWRDVNKPVIERIRKTAFPEGEPQIAFVHVLDLAADGHIKPHVDSVRFCGSTIAGISLLSPSIMRFAHENEPEKKGDVLLKRRSLYIMRGEARHDFTHEILKSETSTFKGEPVMRDRRVSIICRTEADPNHEKDPS